MLLLFQNLRYLSDKYLVLASVVLLVPHLIILTLRLCINPLRFTETVYTVIDLQSCITCILLGE